MPREREGVALAASRLDAPTLVPSGLAPTSLLPLPGRAPVTLGPAAARVPFTPPAAAAGAPESVEDWEAVADTATGPVLPAVSGVPAAEGREPTLCCEGPGDGAGARSPPICGGRERELRGARLIATGSLRRLPGTGG